MTETDNDLNHDTSDRTITPSRSGLLLMSLGSLTIYSALTWLIVHYFHDAPIASLFTHGFSLPLQLLIGSAFGLAAAGVIILAIFHTAMRGILQDYTIIKMLAGMRFKTFDKVQISLFAGVGEGLLFRGAMQPVLGLWVTSLLFVGLHGYIRFTSIKHILFGIIMFSLSVGLGLLFEWTGLIAAMTAHAVYDFVMLQAGTRYAFRRIRPAPPDDAHPAT